MKNILMIVYAVTLPFQLHIDGYIVNVLLSCMFALFIISGVEYELSSIGRAILVFASLWFASYLYALTQTEDIFLLTAEFKRLVTLVVGYFVFSKCTRTQDDHKLQLYAYMLSITVVALWTLSSGVLSGENFSDRKRASGPFGVSWMGSDIAGGYLALSIPLICAWMLAARSKVHKLFGFGGLVICVLALFITYSRGSIVGAVIGVVVIVVVHSWNRHKSILKVLTSLTILVLSFTYLLPVSLKTRIENTFVEGMGGRSQQLDESSQLRIGKWKEGFNAFIENPIIGVGFIQFKEIYRHDPHNSFLQIASEMGIFGIVSFVYLFVVIIREVLKNIRNSENAIIVGSLGCVISYLIVNFFYSNFYRDTVVGSFWILLGLFDSHIRILSRKASLVPVDESG